MPLMTTAYESGNVPPIEVRHRLRIAREYAGLEQDQLAEMIGVSRNTIGNAEKGRVQPRRIVVNAWALACGVPASWLIDGVEPGPPQSPLDGALSSEGASRPRRNSTSDLRIIRPIPLEEPTEKAA